jgi:hypothetical protein
VAGNAGVLCSQLLLRLSKLMNGCHSRFDNMCLLILFAYLYTPIK